MIEQLIGVYGVRFVGNDKIEVSVRVGRERAHVGRVSFVYNRSARPYVAHIEASALQGSPLFHAVEYHSRHLREFAFGVLRYDGCHIFKAAVGISVVQFAQSAYKYEFVAIEAKREALFRQLHVALDFGVFIGFERLVSGGIKRVFYMNAEPLVLCEVWVGQQYCPLTFGIFAFQFCDIALRHLRHSQPRIEQEEMIIGVFHTVV